MTYYAVIDTNVIVSSMLRENSIPGKITDLISEKTIIPLLNEQIIEEYVEVLSRNKFDFTADAIERMIAKLKLYGIFLEREQSIEDFIDKDDIVFYEIVLSARSTMDAYLITGNMKHYPVRSYIVTPAQMMDIIERDKTK